MKLLRLTILTCFFSIICFGQSKKPEYVIIIDNEISTQADVEFYAKQGRIKSMNKGVTEEQYKVLVEKYGDIIGDKMFVMFITLHPEEPYNQTRKSQYDSEPEIPNYDNFNFKIGETPGDFSIELMDGTIITQDDLKGKVVMINFWATWCAPCIMELYDIPETILEPFENQDFVFLPVSIGESKNRINSMMTKLNADGINFNSGFDPKKSFFKQFAKGAIPKMVILDKNGAIQLMSEGNPPENLKKIAGKISELLK